jgi:uroporphyrinogen decarboxylase
MEFCFSSKEVVEVTLQPLRRFPLDAAIIFSDILVIPHILGQKVWFEANHGPKLAAIDFNDLIKNALKCQLPQQLKPVTEAISETKARLDPGKALIGFAGGPWTLLTYMISNGKTNDFSTVLSFAAANSKLMDDLFAVLVDKVSELLCLHIDAGADAVQIFESWAMAVPEELRSAYLYIPLEKIIQRVKAVYPNTPIIYYGRGISKDYPMLNHLDIAFGVDETGDMKDLRKQIPNTVLQGNFSASTLLEGHASPKFDQELDNLLLAMQNTSHILNLGHGINKDTSIASVEHLFTRLHQFYSLNNT